MAAEFCVTCKARYGRIKAGVHRLDGEPACEECFHGGNADAIARCRKSRVNVEEKNMSERICDTCRKPMHGRTKGPTCKACRTAGGGQSRRTIQRHANREPRAKEAA